MLLWLRCWLRGWCLFSQPAEYDWEYIDGWPNGAMEYAYWTCASCGHRAYSGRLIKGDW